MKVGTDLVVMVGVVTVDVVVVDFVTVTGAIG